AAAFLPAGVGDEVIAYIAPTLLGAGLSPVADLGRSTITDALRLQLVETSVIGEGPEANLRLILTPGEGS
ncbi:MAG: dihydrofolate reductase family protein, partial [Nocardioidaceae bacterium]|nr:dihydrofolate reductase family protein [Nocardioidaceae bacterium]